MHTNRYANRRTVRTTILAAAASALAATTAAAQEHEGDIVLLVRDAQVITADAQYNPLCSFGTRLATGNQTNDPGFDSPTSEFPANSEVGFTILQALRAWDGTDFDTIPAERLEMSWGPLGPVTTPLDDSPVPGFTLGVGQSGEFHYHYKFKLTSPAAPGVYLLTLQMWSDDGNIAPSEPIHLLLAQTVNDQAFAEALDWWERNGAWCSADACVADFNGDELVDTRDVLAFLNAWSMQDPSADINADGSVDTRDVLAFLNLWTAGC
ncbi:MAG: GC-type dockerin domain-anchored protein [Phycisphaerales bacterium JB054]